MKNETMSIIEEKIKLRKKRMKPKVTMYHAFAGKCSKHGKFIALSGKCYGCRKKKK